jgi:multidrug efflux pump subunit AcrB
VAFASTRKLALAMVAAMTLVGVAFLPFMLQGGFLGGLYRQSRQGDGLPPV